MVLWAFAPLACNDFGKHSSTNGSKGTHQDGDRSTLSFEVVLLAVDANEACEIADFNNDGILDISAGRNWYAGPDYVP